MNTAKNVPELFGSMVFNETVMQERLPKDCLLYTSRCV